MYAARFGAADTRRWFYFAVTLSYTPTPPPMVCKPRYLGYSTTDSPGALPLYDWYARLRAGSCDQVWRQLWDPILGRYTAVEELRLPSDEQLRAHCVNRC